MNNELLKGIMFPTLETDNEMIWTHANTQMRATIEDLVVWVLFGDEPDQEDFEDPITPLSHQDKLVINHYLRNHKKAEEWMAPIEPKKLIAMMRQEAL